jgi:hypothetical protein
MGILQTLLRRIGWTWGFRWTGYMQITLRRLDVTDHGVFGHLEMGSIFDCVTLERHDTLIPEGIYKVTLYDSPKNKRQVPLIHVPGREYIEIHPANYEYQLEGCIAVGENREGFAVEHSRDTFAQMMALWPVGEVEIRII